MRTVPRLAANQKERKKCESDIPVQEQKISKLKDQMLSAKTNEQYAPSRTRSNSARRRSASWKTASWN